MKIGTKWVLGGVGAVLAWESLWWVLRRHERGTMYAEARARADELKRPLVVVGAPDAWVTAGYPCGDVTVDILKSSCPNSIVADITKPLDFADNSVVVFVSCTLEYLDEAGIEFAIAELNRISGGELWVKRVEPWTLTSVLFPGRRRTLYRGQYPIAHLGRASR